VGEDGDALVSTVVDAAAVDVAVAREVVQQQDKENEPMQPDAFTVWLRRALEDGQRGAPIAQLTKQSAAPPDVADLLATFAVRDASVAVPWASVAVAPAKKAPLPDVSHLIQIVRNERRAWRVERARVESADTLDDVDKTFKKARVSADEHVHSSSAASNSTRATRLQMVLDL
jgi:hypothetical protein